MRGGKIYHVIGGGTVNHVRSHFALAATAYGETARFIAKELRHRHLHTRLHLTKMASAGKSDIETNDQLAARVEEILKDPRSCMIVFNAAVADFKGQIGDIPSGKYAERLQSRDAAQEPMVLTPAEKIVPHIKEERPDIFLIAFKTTAGKGEDVQAQKASALLRQSHADLVLANDTVTRTNMIVTPEGTVEFTGTDRQAALKALVDIACARMASGPS